MPETASTSAAPEMPSHMRRLPMMSKSDRSSHARTLPMLPRPLTAGRRSTALVDTATSESTRAMTSAEIIDAMTPIESVTPKPLIGPEPSRKSSAAASRVVTLESMIALHALLKPTARARRSPADG